MGYMDKDYKDMVSSEFRLYLFLGLVVVHKVSHKAFVLGIDHKVIVHRDYRKVIVVQIRLHSFDNYMLVRLVVGLIKTQLCKVMDKHMAVLYTCLDHNTAVVLVLLDILDNLVVLVAYLLELL